MNADSFLQAFQTALDEISGEGFDYADVQRRLPSARLLSVDDRLRVLRGFTLERAEFFNRIDFFAGADFDVTAEVQQIEEGRCLVLRDLLLREPTREKVLAAGRDLLESMDSNTAHFELQEKLRADLASGEDDRLVEALSHLQLRSEALAEWIGEDLAELAGGEHERRKLQFLGSLDAYQAAKSKLVGAWLGVVLLFALHYGKDLPTRDLAIAGVSGFARGIEKFDGKRGFEFGKYVVWWIRQAQTFAAVKLRGLSVADIELMTAMREQIGKQRWQEWRCSPDPADVAGLGLSRQEILEIIARYEDRTIHPVHLQADPLTPACAGGEREWVQLSENVITASNPYWWV